MSPSRSGPSRSGTAALACALSLVIGVVLARGGFASVPPLLPLLFVVPLLRRMTRPARTRPVFTAHLWIGWALGAGLLGACAVAVHEAARAAPALLADWRRHGFEAYSTAVELTGRLIDREPLPPHRTALLLRLDTFRLPGRPAHTGRPGRPVTIRLTLPAPRGDGPRPWRPGDRLAVTARLGSPRSFRNPGAFDYATYQRARGVDLTGTIKSARLVRVLERRRTLRWSAAPSIRSRIVASLQRAAGEGEQGRVTAAFLAALLIGERSELPPDLETSLRRAGVYHIIALSGLNVGLIALLAAGVLRLVPLKGPTRRWLTAGAVLAYGWIARASGSIHRATLMGLIVLIGRASGRRVSALGTIAVASMLLLLHRPTWIADAGFQLTFGATLAIVILAPRRARDPVGARGVTSLVRRVLVEPMGVSAAALGGTALITAHHFHTIAPAALVANIAAVPIAALLLYLALLIVALDPLVPSLGRLAASAAEALVAALREICRAASGPPAEPFTVLPPPPVLVIGAGVAILCAGLSGRTGRRVALVALLALHLACCGLGRIPRPPTGRLELVVFDVGQGDAILVRFPNGLSMLVDAGGFSDGRFDVGERVVAPALRALGILRLDILAITHAHQDHMGGAAAILEQFSPGALWLGAMPDGHAGLERLERAASENGVTVLRPLAGATLRLGGSRVQVLHPGPGPRSGPRNDDSLVLHLRHGRRAALLTGDLEATGEDLVLGRPISTAADFLKVAHHGSASSSTRRFLGRVEPEIAVISVGGRNPWGHPDPAILGRLAERGAVVYRTDRNGAVAVSTDGDEPWSVRLLGAGPASGLDAGHEVRGGRDEAEDEDEKRQPRDQVPAAPQAGSLVEQGRMARPDEREDQPEEDQVKALHEDPDEDQHQRSEPRDEAVGAAREGVHHVSAVELPERQEIERGREQAQPRGRDRRMEPDPRDPVRLEEDRYEEPEQRAGGEDHVPLPRQHRYGFRLRQAINEIRHRDDEARDGARDSDVEQRAAIGDRRSDPNDGSEGAEGVRAGQEERPRGVNAIDAAIDEMPHLVGAQDRHHSDRIRDAGRPARGGDEHLQEGGPAPLVAGEERPRHERRIERREEEDEVDERMHRPTRSHDRGRGHESGRSHAVGRRVGAEPAHVRHFNVCRSRVFPGRRSAAGLSQISEILAGLEANGLAGRNPHLGAGAGIAADPLLARLDLEDPEAAKLDPLPPAHRFLHGVQDRLHGHHGLDPGDVGRPGHVVDDVGLDHAVLQHTA